MSDASGSDNEVAPTRQSSRQSARQSARQSTRAVKNKRAQEEKMETEAASESSGDESSGEESSAASESGSEGSDVQVIRSDSPAPPVQNGRNTMEVEDVDSNDGVKVIEEEAEDVSIPEEKPTPSPEEKPAPSPEEKPADSPEEKGDAEKDIVMSEEKDDAIVEQNDDSQKATEENDVSMVEKEDVTKGEEETSENDKEEDAEKKMNDDEDELYKQIGGDKAKPGTAEQLAKIAASIPAPQIAATPAPPAKSTPLLKYWKAVIDDPADFTGWTYLLQYVEQETTIADCREAFDAFLKRYPYCYGYWKKYADVEKKHKKMDMAESVYERGLRAIPLSIDLWSHYITFYYSKLDESDPQRAQKIRKLYERAVAAAGMDFRSDKLWESYIAWERDNQHPAKVTALYDRLLAMPTYLYSHHFDKFEGHVKSHSPMDLLHQDEFITIREEYIENKKKEKIKANPAGGDAVAEPAADDDDDDDDAAPPGTEIDAAPPGEDAAPGEDNPTSDETETEALRNKIIELRRVVHKANEEEVSKRWTFEEGVRRPYFHVKPLEKVQIKNWRDYLEFEVAQGKQDRIVILFERCMIACALYEEFWIRFAKYMEGSSTEQVSKIYERGCSIHLPKKPHLHLHWAAFEERTGDVTKASKILDDLETNVPGLAMVALRKVSIERRQGNYNSVEDMYVKYLDSPKKQIRSFYAIKYARYLARISGNHEKASRILKDALEDDPKNAKIFLQLVDIEYGRSEVNESNMLAVFQLAIDSQLEVDHRVAFSQRQLEYLEDFGSDVGKCSEAYEAHQTLLKELQAKNKRKAEEDADAKAKKPRLDPMMSNGNMGSQPAASQPQAPDYSQQQQGGQQGADQNAAAWQQWHQYNQQQGYQQGGGGGGGGYGGGYGQQQQWGGYGQHGGHQQGGHGGHGGGHNYYNH